MRVFVIFIIAALASFASAGGGGPLDVRKWKGDVQIRPISKSAFFRQSIDGPQIKLAHAWQPVRKGTYVGTFEIRTARDSWLQFNGACLDSGSRMKLVAMADLHVELARGSVSERDGRKGRSLLKPGSSATW
jgi:hypothetical protein